MPEQAGPTLIAVKLSPPDDAGIVLRRDQLARVSAAADAPLLLVHAGAGYGKTSLVAAASSRLGWNALWYKLDALDRDPALFLTRLATAMRRRVPGFGQALGGVLGQSGQQAPPSAQLLAALVGALTRDVAAELHIVLDDYEEAGASREFNEALQYVIANLPDHIHTVLLTRVEPALTLARWRLEGRVAEIGEDDLRFDVDQAARVVSAQAPGRPPLPRVQFERLLELTEGWPASMLLIGRALRVIEASALEDALERPRLRQEIFDYLAEQVFVGESAEVQRFLLRTCLLEYVTAELAERVSGMDAARTHLDYLAQNRVFTFADVDEASYRYHNLFRDFLREKCRVEEGASALQALCADTSRALEESGHWEEAIRLDLSEGEVTAAVAILESHGLDAIGDCSAYTLRGLRDVLSLRRGDDPWALLLEGHLARREGRSEDAIARLRAATEAFGRAGDERRVHQALIALQTAYESIGDYEQALDAARAILSLEPADNERREALIAMAQALTHLTRWDELDDVMSILRAGDINGAGVDTLLSGHIAPMEAVSGYLRGHFREARLTAARRLRMLRPSLSQLNLISLSNTLGLLHLLVGEYQAADSELEWCIETVRRFGHGYMEATVVDNRAVLLAARGRVDEALALFGKLESEAAALGDIDTLAFVLVHRGTALRRAGRIEEAAESYARALRAAGEQALPYQASSARVGLAYSTALVDGVSGDDARAALDEAAAWAGDRGLGFVALKARFFLADVALRGGDGDVAREGLKACLPRQLELGHLHFLSQELVANPALALTALGVDFRPDVVTGITDAIARNHGARGLLLEIAGRDARLATACLHAAAAHREEGHLAALLSLGRRHADPRVRTLASELDLGEPSDVSAFPELTAREREILTLLAEGLRNDAIAERLYVAPATVKTHVHRVLRKLGVEDRLQATLVYRERSGR
jgi:LuxR family maltose regulon positive regulatory protein